MPSLAWDGNADAIDHYRLQWRGQGSAIVSELATTELTADIPLSFGVWLFDLRAVDAQGRESAPASLVWTNSPAYCVVIEKSSSLNGPWTNIWSFPMTTEGTNGFYRLKVEPQ